MSDPAARLRGFLSRERDRERLEDLQQASREVMPGTSGGRALPAAPLDHRARGTARGTLQALSPTPVGGGTPDVHHVTATAEASQSIAAGVATVQWGDEADAPTDRRGFTTFSGQLAAGSVGDIPIDRDGFLILKPKLQFEDSAGTALDETGVDVTVKVQRIRDGIVSTVRGPLVGTNWIGVSGPIDCGDAKNGDKFRVTIDPDTGIKCSGTIQAAQWITGQSAAASWTQVLEADVYSLTFDGASWWVTEGDSGLTVSQYDADWALQGSFETDFGLDKVRGITHDGTDLWVTGDADNDMVKQYSTAGVKQSEFQAGSTSVDGAAWDGTDLWVLRGAEFEIVRFDTSGTVQQTWSVPSKDFAGLAYHDGQLWLVNTSDARVDVYETDGTLVDTIDVSGATESPTGVFVASDGTLYVAEDGVSVWRRD